MRTTEERLDQFARFLARPMGRRRALGVIGAATLAASFPALRPRGAAAQGFYPVKCPGYGCNVGQKCCAAGRGACCSVEHQCCGGEGTAPCCPPSERMRPDGSLVENFCGNGTYGCTQKIHCPYGLTPCGAGSGAYTYQSCCNKRTERCESGRCEPRCTTGPQCGRRCCTRDQECVNRRCLRKCPPGRVRCRTTCCPRGQRCVDGRCQKCARNQQPCGDECCPRHSYCCGTTEAGGTCCPKSGGSCCSNTDAQGRTKRICCRPPTTCARPVNVSAGGASAGVDREADYFCCPQERYVKTYRSCCPPGHVALGTFVLPAGGGGGQCCREDKLCGESCCSTGTPSIPELDQTCCSGKCTSTQYDPRNCGACGNVCPSGQRCQNGACVADS